MTDEALDATFARALEHHRGGDVGTAEALYRRVLQANAAHDRATFLLGSLLHEAGRATEGLELMKRALVLAPSSATYYAAVGEAYRRSGEPGLSLRLFECAAQLAPDSVALQLMVGRALCAQGEAERATGHLMCAVRLGEPTGEASRLLSEAWAARDARRANANPQRSAPPEPPQARRGRRPQESATAVQRAYSLAVAHHQAGRLKEAEAQYRKLLKSEPNHAAALFWFGSLALESGRFAFAAELLSRACALDPVAPDYHSNLGEARLRAGELGRSVAAFQRALELEPERAERHFNLALALRHTGDTERAIEHFLDAVRLSQEQPQFQLELARELVAAGQEPRAIGHFQASLLESPSVEAALELAAVLRGFGSPEAAHKVCGQALELDPTRAASHLELGLVLSRLKRMDEAAESFRRALELDPALARAGGELALALFGAGRVEEAVELWERVIAVDPSDATSDSNRVFALAFHPGYDDAKIADAARAWAKRHEAPLAALAGAHQIERSPEKKLRIGYVCSVFREHALGVFIVPLVVARRRETFELFCYSGVSQPDWVTSRLRASADVWRDVVKLSDRELAERIRADGIDVLVDMNMHMATPRLRTFAHRPAPVQLSWAYPGTTGLGSIDYRLTDRHIDPPGAPLPYAEASIVLPDTYWCYDPLIEGPEPGPLPALSRGHVRFGNLNAVWKLSRQICAVWSNVLRACPSSTLTLLGPGMLAGSSGGSVESERRMMRFFEDEGIEPERIQILPRASRSDYFAYYRDIDIGLDSLPYAGHTTTLDALWMGVPVLTLAGATVVGRAGVCFAQNLDLPELVAQNESELVERALSYARNLDAVAELRRTLRARLQASPLMDGPRFARNMEAACRAAWRHHCAGTKAERIDLPLVSA